VALEPVPLDENGSPAVKLAARNELESRLDDALTALRQRMKENHGGPQQTADHLCLFSRWYYRPQAKRIGEICFTQSDSDLPKKAILRAISRIYRQNPLSNKDTSATSGPSGQSSA
jgi:hypothetical protein